MRYHRLRRVARAAQSICVVCFLLGPIVWAGKVIPDPYQDALAEAKRRMAISAEFRAAHPYLEQIGAVYVQTLKRENFYCRLQYRGKVWVDREHPLTLRTAPEPVVQCFNEQFGRPNCTTFRVGISLDWDGEGLQLSEMRSKLSTSRIIDAVFVCESDFTKKERESVLEGERGGYVVPL